MPSAQALKRPAFLGRIAGAPHVENAAFKHGSGGQFRPPIVPAASAEPEGDEVEARVAAEAKKLAAQFSERTAAAVELLRATAERLAAEARTDALEIGFLVARRILEMELSAGPEPLVSLVRSAVMRLGESRRIAVHLCPHDAELITGIVESRGPQAVGTPAISRLEIVHDSSLNSGDCLVDGDLVTVDGRINARIEELRRVLDANGLKDAS
jgi:flagellar assembly protein FliH